MKAWEKSHFDAIFEGLPEGHSESPVLKLSDLILILQGGTTEIIREFWEEPPSARDKSGETGGIGLRVLTPLFRL